MIWHLIAVFIMGLCAGGLMFLLRKLSGNRLPKWLVPVSAGVAMIGYLAYYDYGWFEFKSGQMPRDSVIVATQQKKSFFRPWSYIWPSTNAFTVFDGRSRKGEQDGQLLVEYYLYTFYKDPLEGAEVQSHLMNCSLMERVIFDKENPEEELEMEKVSDSDEMYQRLCL